MVLTFYLYLLLIDYHPDLLHYSNNTSNLLAVIPAVVAVNTVIGIYIYLAWNSEPWKEKFQERTKDE